MTFASLVPDIARELNLSTSNPRLMSQLYVWANSVYRSVVYAEEYPWRKRDVPLITAAAGTGTAPFTKGADTHGPTTAQSGLDDDLCSYNFLVLDDYDTMYELENVAYSGGKATMELQEAFIHPTATYDFTIYKPRYRLAGVREDWVTGVYNETDETLLQRVYPNHSLSYIRQGIKNPSTPQFFFLDGMDVDYQRDRASLLSISPAPDRAYELTVKTLLGVSELTEGSSEIIIPDLYVADVFMYGVGFLYNVKQKDQEGAKLYGGMFNKLLQTMIGAAGKEPGRTRRLLGYTVRDAGVRDPDVPKDWDPGF